ncbi:MAG: lipopolysaccharide biosynthesis protein [Limisphaerales bacterium]
MSRLKKFTRSLLSGYFMLGANIFYTLASVPLALHYLDKPEFALWALTIQIAGYVALIDLGMSASIARILIDHKDDRSTGVYGSVIKTGALVGIVQGALIFAAGTSLSLVAGSLLKIPIPLRSEFAWLIIGQAALSGITFSTRIFNQLLFAHQRMDVNSYGSCVSFFFSLAAMWAGFANGFGVYSFLMGQAVMVLSGIAVNITGCFRLGLLPKTGEWGAASRERFRELFAFGQGMFLISVGSQFINASQTILLTRLLGLEEVATWTVCIRAYTMVTMVVWQIMNYSAPALCEMIARKEQGKLLGRMRDLTVLMAGLSLVCGTVFAAANGAFVWIWTTGKISWPPINNVLLALWFFACSVMRVHTGVASATKQLHFLRFIYLVEGSVFIGLNLLAYHIESMTLMLVFSLASTLTFTLPYGLWRTRKYFGMNWRELLAWFHPTWQLAWRLVPVAVAVWWLARNLPVRWQLVLDVVVPGIFGTAVLLRYGLGKSLQIELQSKIPLWARKFLVRSQSLL